MERGSSNQVEQTYTPYPVATPAEHLGNGSAGLMNSDLVDSWLDAC